MKKNLTRVFPIIALLIKWSGIAVTDGRNKIGGTVFATGRGGAFARNKVTPVNRRSAGQSQVRGWFGGFSQAWRSLTAGQHTAWNALAELVTYNNIFGDAKKYSGKALFQRLNINLSKVEATTITDAPTLSDSPTAIVSFAPLSDVSATSLVLKVLFMDGGYVVPTGNKLYVRATPKLSKGVTSAPASAFRFLSIQDEAADTGVSIGAATYSAIFGSAPAVGDTIFLEVSSINSVSGFTTPVAVAKLAIQA